MAYGDQLQRKSERARRGATVVQRKAAPGKGSLAEAIAPRSGPARAGAGDGGGSPLPDDIRSKMEGAFSTDFSAVRVHEGPQAQALGAQAYAQGTDVHFAPGQLNLGSQQGQELLGHELAHVVQQSQGRASLATQAKGAAINADAGLEREADEAGARAARGEAAGIGAAGLGGAGAVVQRKVVFDAMFTANTGALGKQAEKLESLQRVIAKIEEHPINDLMAVDIYVEGGQQEKSTKMGSTVVQTIDGKAIQQLFFEFVMTEELIRAREMQIGVKVNLEPDDYQDYEEDLDYDDEEPLGEMIATFLHEVHLHVLPKLDQMVRLKKADPGSKEVPIAKEQIHQLSPTMELVMNTSKHDDHDDPASWSMLLDAVELVASELTQTEDESRWLLAFNAVMCVVNDVMTHTAPEPEKQNLPNLTKHMPKEQKLQLYLRADKLATTFAELRSKKFPDSDEDSNSQ